MLAPSWSGCAPLARAPFARARWKRPRPFSRGPASRRLVRRAGRSRRAWEQSDPPGARLKGWKELAGIAGTSRWCGWRRPGPGRGFGCRRRCRPGRLAADRLLDPPCHPQDRVALGHGSGGARSRGAPRPRRPCARRRRSRARESGRDRRAHWRRGRRRPASVQRAAASAASGASGRPASSRKREYISRKAPPPVPRSRSPGSRSGRTTASPRRPRASCRPRRRGG